MSAERPVITGDEVRLTVGHPTTLRTHFCLHWRLVAEANLSLAEAARHKQTDDAVGVELRASMVAICAVAFSVEALSRELAQEAVPVDTRAAWDRNKLAAQSRLREVVRHSTTIPRAQVDNLVDELVPAIEDRGLAAHFEGGLAVPGPHPSGNVLASVESSRFTLEAATRAVDAMGSLYAAILAHPRRATRAIINRHTRVLTFTPPPDESS